MNELMELREDVKKLLTGQAATREQVLGLRDDLGELKSCLTENGRIVGGLVAATGLHADRLDRLRFWIGSVAAALLTVAAKVIHSIFYGNN